MLKKILIGCALGLAVVAGMAQITPGNPGGSGGSGSAFDCSGASSGNVLFLDGSACGGFGSWDGETLTWPFPTVSGRNFIFDSGDPDNSDFYVNLSNTVNPGSVTRPNPVMQWGYNLSPGGSSVTAGETAFGFGLEGHYQPDTNSYNEAHLYFVDKAGLQHRPWSIPVNKDTLTTAALFHADNYVFGTHLDTNSNFLSIQSTSLAFLPYSVATVPTAPTS